MFLSVTQPDIRNLGRGKKRVCEEGMVYQRRELNEASLKRKGHPSRKRGKDS